MMIKIISCQVHYIVSLSHLDFLIDEFIFVGITTRMTLRKLLQEGDCSSYDEVKFFSSVRAYYTRAMSYALENLPITDPLLRNASFLNFDTKDDSNFTEVEYFVERYMYCNDNLCLCIDLATYYHLNHQRNWMCY